MVELVYLGTLLTLVVLHEIAEIRHERRENKLYAQIRSLENRIHSRDLVSYKELQAQDRGDVAIGVRAKEAQKNGVLADAVDERFFEGNVAYTEDNQ